MNKLLLYLTSAFLLIVFAACSDDNEPEAAKAVMTSAQILDFIGQNAPSQTITVYSDAAWNVDAPEWIVVTPTSGSGTTDVVISVKDNLREGLLDNPRKAEVIFHGATIASRAIVKVSQKGDNYRDCDVYKLREVIGLEDETYIGTSNIYICAITSSGVIGTDDKGQTNIIICTDNKLSKGNVISLLGQKLTDDMGMPIIKAEQVQIIENTMSENLITPKDITMDLDSYNSRSREYITLTGILNGNLISVDGSSNSVSLIDLPENINLKSVNGHIVQLYGFFAGIASPYIRVNYAEIKDLGEAQVIYWSEDFEWLSPFAESAGAGRTVETDDLDATAPQIVNAKLADGTSALDALLDRGYNFLRVTTKTDGECIYLQQNYLKFGKTSYQAGIILPPIGNIPSDAKILFSFDWCPMRQGSGKIDPVNLILIVKNDADEVVFEIPTHNWENDHRLEWISETIELTGVKIDENTQVILRQTQWPASTANRWFLDNIKIYSKL